MKKIMLPIATLAVTAVLASCSTESYKNRWAERNVMENKTDNGQIVKVGMQGPHDDWGCEAKGQESYNWRVVQAESAYGGGYGNLSRMAMRYINAHPSDKINYVYLDIPNQKSIGAINYTALRKANINYYTCANPPKANLDPFDNKINNDASADKN